MKRKTKLMLNSASSLLYQVVAIICSFILPRFFLITYGSEINGLVSSITQFLGLIMLAECGVGTVVQASLYKPLAKNDTVAVSQIVLSSDRFFRKIAYLLLGYVGVLSLVYPLITLGEFDYLFTLGLIFAISVSTFAQYYIGMTYRLLLSADQLGFYQYIIHTVSLIVNTVSCILLMGCGASVQVVKLTTSLIFMIQPVLLSVIAKRRYKIDRKQKLEGEPIKQKWNGIAQHIAGVVLTNTDTVVLTLFSTLENVSVYAVYHLVVHGLQQIVVSVTNGMRSMLGNMLANDEKEELHRSFSGIEWFLHTLVTLLFSVTAVLILPFVRVYTAGISDVNYIVPAFAYLIIGAQAVYCYRLPYYMLVNAAGHFKQTQRSAIIEAVINVAVSVVLVSFFGLVGVAIGTLAAMTYRTLYLVNYLRKDILYRSFRPFVKHILVDACAAALLIGATVLLPGFFALGQVNYLGLVILGIKVGITGAVFQLVVNAIFYRKEMAGALGSLRKK